MTYFLADSVFGVSGKFCTDDNAAQRYRRSQGYYARQGPYVEANYQRAAPD
jgi:hypothetical protein